MSVNKLTTLELFALHTDIEVLNSCLAAVRFQKNAKNACLLNYQADDNRMYKIPEIQDLRSSIEMLQTVESLVTDWIHQLSSKTLLN